MQIFFSSMADLKSRTSAGWDTKPNVEEAHFPPITKHFFVSLWAVVHVAEYAPIPWHRTQGAFVVKGTTAECCIVVMCLSVRSWCRGLRDKKTRENNKEPNLIEADVSCESWAYGCLDARRREGAILVQQSGQRRPPLGGCMMPQTRTYQRRRCGQTSSK